MDKFDKFMQDGLRLLADDMIRDIEEWERTHPEEAKKLDQELEEHREEFMEKLMKKIEETGRGHLLSK